MSKADVPAYPSYDDMPGNFPGLTKREYFIAMAMQGLCANPAVINDDVMKDNIFWINYIDELEQRATHLAYAAMSASGIEE